MTKSRRKTENGEGTMETPICPEHFRHARVWLEHQIGLLSKRLSDLESRVDHLEVNVAEERVQPDEDAECRKLQSHDDEQNIPLDISSVCQMLARSLLAAKHGQGFLPAIESSIGLYKMAREELNLLADFPESSGAAVEHCRTAILRLLTEQAICLEQIGVTIEEVDEGADLIKGRHHVVRPLATKRKSQLNTVARCLQPSFRWQSLYGDEQVRPAEVSAYTKVLHRFGARDLGDATSVA